MGLAGGAAAITGTVAIPLLTAEKSGFAPENGSVTDKNLF
jgi:hypothetical protein